MPIANSNVQTIERSLAERIRSTPPEANVLSVEMIKVYFNLILNEVDLRVIHVFYKHSFWWAVRFA